MKALDEISNGLPLFLSRAQRPDGNSCFGSGLFWLQRGHAFYAFQCSFGGLLVHGIVGHAPFPQYLDSERTLYSEQAQKKVHRRDVPVTLQAALFVRIPERLFALRR